MNLRNFAEKEWKWGQSYTRKGREKRRKEDRERARKEEREGEREGETNEERERDPNLEAMVHSSHWSSLDEKPLSGQPRLHSEISIFLTVTFAFISLSLSLSHPCTATHRDMHTHTRTHTWSQSGCGDIDDSVLFASASVPTWLASWVLWS